MSGSSRKYGIRRRVRFVLLHLALLAAALLVLLPFAWIVSASFDRGGTLVGSKLWPDHPSLVHYRTLFTQTDFPLWYANTLKIAVANTVLAVVLSTGCAYVFSRYRFKGRKPALTLTLLLQLFPSVLSMTAVYLLLLQTHLLNTHLGLILVYAGGQLPFNIWLCKGYYDSLPSSLDEAAIMDGASARTIFFKIVLPIGKPIALFLAVTNFLMPWMDFILPRIVLRSSEKKTMALGLYDLVSFDPGAHFGLFAAGAILVAAPITAIYVYLQNHIVQGVSSGASKL